MFTIYDIKREYTRLDAKTGMNIATTIPVKISNRCTTTRGKYSYSMSNSYGSKPFKESITISSFVLHEDEADFIDTIRHEYAHAMAARIHERFGLAHGPEWQECCHIVGCRDTATRTATEAQKAIIDKRKTYIVACECGHEFIYHRKGKIVSMVEAGNINGLRCPYCEGHNFYLKK